MANPNISLLGATYSGVSGVTLPTQGGGTATFPWVEGSQSITQNGTVDVTNLAEVVVNVSGGGGASNVVTGTFKGTTTGAAMDISLPYTGSGYPIVVAIYPTTGYGSNTAIYSLLQRYAVVSFSAVKRTHATPTYAGSNAENQMFVLTIRKSSTSTASTVQANTGYDVVIYSSSGAAAQSTICMRFKDSKTMSVYIAASSYGFAANIEYTYYVIYSS